MNARLATERAHTAGVAPSSYVHPDEISAKHARRPGNRISSSYAKGSGQICRIRRGGSGMREAQPGGQLSALPNECVRQGVLRGCLDRLTPASGLPAAATPAAPTCASPLAAQCPFSQDSRETCGLRVARHAIRRSPEHPLCPAEAGGRSARPAFGTDQERMP
jgi:hypothetical protein